MKKIVNISGIDPLALLGTNDQNLKLLENQSSAKIVVRGNDMIIDGNESDIDLIELVIKDMIITINQKGFVDKDDVKTLLRLFPKSITITESKFTLPKVYLSSNNFNSVFAL